MPSQRAPWNLRGLRQASGERPQGDCHRLSAAGLQTKDRAATDAAKVFLVLVANEPSRDNDIGGVRANPECPFKGEDAQVEFAAHFLPQNRSLRMSGDLSMGWRVSAANCLGQLLKCGLSH
jgi:hypothetical protein